MVEIAKGKYQKMMEVRQRSFVEKKELKRVIVATCRKDRINPKNIR